MQLSEGPEQHLHQTVRLINQHLEDGERDDRSLSVAGAGDWRELKRLLARRIQHMLEQRQERLWQALYRIDVAESKVKAALQAASVAEMASQLADLVIERELQKVITRARYRNS